MLSRSSSARVTSDQHQSGHGSTTGRVRRLAGDGVAGSGGLDRDLAAAAAKKR